MSYISRAALGAVGGDPFAGIRPTAPTNYGTPAPSSTPALSLTGKATTSSSGPAPGESPMDFLKRIGAPVGPPPSPSSGGPLDFLKNLMGSRGGGASGNPLQAAMKEQQPYQAATAPAASSGKIFGLSPTMLAIAGAAVIGGVLYLRKK